MAAISSLLIDRASLEVAWDDGTTTRYPWIWLRDHAHDDDTLHPVTQQRQLDTASVPVSLTAHDVALLDGALEIGWGDGSPASVLPVEFLARFRIPVPPRAAVDTDVRLWDAASIAADTPTVAWEDVMESEDGVAAWLGRTVRDGFCIVAGTPPTPEATEALLRRIGYVRETIFGGMWDFTADLAKADTAYTNLELRPHTDGTYSHDAPGVQLLHCLHFEGTGGESTMVDAFAIADRLRCEAPEHFATLSRVVVPGQYVGDGSHLVAARPVWSWRKTGRAATRCDPSPTY